MKRLLVTGHNGFVGRALKKIVATKPLVQAWALAEVPEAWDLLDLETTEAIVRAAAPDAVIHLAAQSWVPDAFRDPETTLDVNVIGTLHLLQALGRVGFRGRMLHVGSADVYGRVPEDAAPVAEEHLPAPRNPYAVSKLAAEALCRQWAMTEGMDIVLARPFNHVGPGQSDRFVISDFAHQIAEIKLGLRGPVVATGDIDVTRDFTDVRDVVLAYFELLAAGASGEVYNVCSGRSQSIRSLLGRLAAIAGVTATTKQEPSRMRRSEQRNICGDPTKIARATGWQAVISIDDSLSAMLKFWESEAGG